ncbi:PC3-like endoprotease variant B [Watersipora subatra]|uniref:PC3-like endoprotease variant B n=1 Tax=Watersipora subatra TaxID=2589382 RepID=UPI00355BB4FC
MSITKELLFITAFALVQVFGSQGSDYVNQFVAYVKGNSTEAEEVVSFLTKRSANIVSVINSDSYGHVIHFSHKDIHSISKRSALEHTTISDISSHIYINKVEQERILFREKRDYYSDETIAKARQLIQEYLDELNSKRSGAKVQVIEGHESNIEHDKQRELSEPLYYENKDVFKRFDTEESPASGPMENREYSPDEERVIQLNDEHWRDQWYLNNRGQAGGPRGLDINVVPAWQQGYSGRGVSVCILDDGIEHTHDDLRDNYRADISEDFNSEDDSDPMPNPENLDGNSHGTRCAGEIAAVANNSVCGVGVAFSAHIGGVRILDGSVTDALEASALLFKNQEIDIYSASWGPRDDGKTMEAPAKHCQNALKQGAREGRGGKGSIFVWATGNGGYNGDDCAADGYVSSPYTLSIGSINNYAESTYFMEWCPSTLAVIYTGGFHTKAEAMSNDELSHPILKIVTTDVRNKCTLNFQGTSSAAPLAAGVVALVLEANPKLTWRDVQHIVVLTSKVPNAIETGWTINGAGLHINDKFGYGTLDAAQMVQLAQIWSNVGPQHRCVVQSPTISEFNSATPLETTLDTDGCQKSKEEEKHVDKVEHVQIHVKLMTARRGDIRISLLSPAGTNSEMLSPRRKDDSKGGIDFTFMTVRCWNENPRGTWKLTITDTGADSDVSTFYGWSLTVLGTAQKTTTRDTSSLFDEKAYNPSKGTLNEFMTLESDAAVNVNIKPGEESDVIRDFASADQNPKHLGSKDPDG